jgi:hypothetical protein
MKQRDGFCTTCHPNYVPTAVGSSKICCQWIDMLEEELGVKIQHTHYDPALPGGIKRDEFRAPCLPRSPVDGYCEELDTVFEFLGDDVHGHPRLWSKRTQSQYGKPLEECYTKTQLKLQILDDSAYHVVYIWECDFREWLRGKIDGQLLTDINRTFRDQLLPRPPQNAQ